MAQSSSRKKSKSKTKTRVSVKRKVKMPKRKTAKKKTPKKAKKAKKAKAKKVAKKTLAKKTAKKVATAKPVRKIAKLTSKAVVLAQTVAPVATTPRLNVGDIAPTFTLNDQTGAPVSLSDFVGKKVVLYFYPKDDTPGCTKEACSFRDHLPTFDGADAVILGVSFDDQASHEKFISKYGLNFKLLSDSDKKVANDYGCYVQKNMYGNISMGIERSTFVIDRNGVIAAAFRRVSVDGHTQEVLETLSKIS